MTASGRTKLAISAWVWTANPEENNFEFINRAASIGYKGVEIPTFTGDLDKKGLMETLSSLSTPVKPIIVGGGSDKMDFTSADEMSRKNAERYIKKMVDVCEYVNSDLICGPLYSPVSRLKKVSDSEREKILSRVATSFKKVSAFLENSGIKIALEPMCRYDTYLINTVEQAKKLVEQIDSENFGILLDTFHMNIEEESLQVAFETAGNLAFHIQVCENNRGIPGKGQLNWKEIRDLMNSIGYENWVSVESFTPYDVKFSEMMRIWRKLSPDQNLFAEESYSFLNSLFLE